MWPKVTIEINKNFHMKTSSTHILKILITKKQVLLKELDLNAIKGLANKIVIGIVAIWNGSCICYLDWLFMVHRPQKKNGHESHSERNFPDCKFIRQGLIIICKLSIYGSNGNNGRLSFDTDQVSTHVSINLKSVGF